MIEAIVIAVSYDESEDRIFLDARSADGGQRLVLTRRITHRLLSAFVALLERSSAALQRAPADMWAEVIAIEHHSAVIQSKATSPVGGSYLGTAQSNMLTVALVAKVDVQVTPGDFHLLFYANNEPVVSVRLYRHQFHKLLAALDRFATAAGWEIRHGAEWLDPASLELGQRRIS